jgi:hypothetical protein
MGLTKVRHSPGLSVEIDHARRQYAPGDTISGRVELNTASDSAIGDVTVAFWGRAKSRIIQHHGQSATYHRGRTPFFRLQQTLYQGHYTHRPGSFGWPFEFVVPAEADPDCVLHGGNKWKPHDHFRSTTDAILDDEKDDDNNATLCGSSDLDLVLPASMYHSRLAFGRQIECFVEYVLEATLTEPAGLHVVRGPQSKTSTVPVTFHPRSTPEPIQAYDLTASERLVTVATLKLLPEHAGTNLGIRDRARSIFHRDTVPKFSFRLTVQAPTVIQLFHPRPIPFLVTAHPDRSPERTTIDTLPEVKLRSVKVELRALIRCRAPGTYTDTKTYEIPLLSHRPPPPSRRLLPLVVVEEKASSSASQDSSSLDLGRLYDLRLGNANLGSRLETPLCPSFTSYNVAREYHLTWEVEVECADKTERFSSARGGTRCRVILPPATAMVEEKEGNNHPMVGVALTPATTSPSTDSDLDGRGHPSTTSFWSGRRPGEGGAAFGREKDKKTKQPGVMDDQGSAAKRKAEAKAREAAEEREPGDGTPSYSRSQSRVPADHNRHDSSSPLDGDTTTDADADMGMDVHVEADHTLPRYAP